MTLYNAGCVKDGTACTLQISGVQTPTKKKIAEFVPSRSRENTYVCRMSFPYMNHATLTVESLGDISFDDLELVEYSRLALHERLLHALLACKQTRVQGGSFEQKKQFMWSLSY